MSDPGMTSTLLLALGTGCALFSLLGAPVNRTWLPVPGWSGLVLIVLSFVIRLFGGVS